MICIINKNAFLYPIEVCVFNFFKCCKIKIKMAIFIPRHFHFPNLPPLKRFFSYISLIIKSIRHNTVIIPYDFDFSINQAKEDGEEDCELPKELVRLLKQKEKMIQPHQQLVDVINMGSKEDWK